MMKSGKSLQELATVLEHQHNTKKDYLADSRGLSLTDNGSTLDLGDLGRLSVSESCHEQIASRINIPKKYYDRMKNSYPGLLCHNVNHWFGNTPSQHLIRSLDGQARAFLSDRYRPLDNYDLANTVLP